MREMGCLPEMEAVWSCWGACVPGAHTFSGVPAVGTRPPSRKVGAPLLCVCVRVRVCTYACASSGWRLKFGLESTPREPSDSCGQSGVCRGKRDTARSLPSSVVGVVMTRVGKHWGC